MYLPVILGTARKGRESENVARFMLQEAIMEGFESEIIDVRDYRIDATDNTQKTQVALRLSEKIEKADGFILVVPEYNHGYPGELKMMLDLLYQQYARKPAGICGVSSGGLGGCRVVEQIRLISIEFRMVPIREALYFSTVQDLFDDGGHIMDESYHDRASVFFSELSWYARALKAAREELS